jgi:coenzyme PQQ precursor peptide PqqA
MFRNTCATSPAWSLQRIVRPHIARGFRRSDFRPHFFHALQETTMQWTAPAYTDLRFGFEITMYIATR